VVNLDLNEFYKDDADPNLDIPAPMKNPDLIAIKFNWK
jgi:hypothetical protein